jgi:putative addiction module CopG family antidote
MTVNLPPELARYIQEKVDRGEFESQDAFLREATRLYQELEARHLQLRSDVQLAIEQIENGNGSEFAHDQELREFFEDIKRRGRTRLNAAK